MCTHPVITRPHRKTYSVTIVLEDVVVDIHVKRFQHREAGIAVVVHMVAGYDSVVRAPVEE